MTKSKFIKCKVQCDNPDCDWKSKDKVDIYKWHKKLCPKCGKCEIINDVELKIIEGMIIAEKIGLIHHPSTKKRGVLCQLDLASLRK